MDNYEESMMPVGRNKGVLFVLLDAFRWDYVNPEDAPTIHKLTEKSVYVKKLVSSSGFTQRSAIFMGSLSDSHGNFTMYIRDKKTSPFKLLRPFTTLLRGIKPEGYFHRVSRKFINQLPKLFTEWAPPGRIPSEILHHISVVEDMTPIDQEGTLPQRTVFDEYRKAGIEYKYYMAPASGHDEPTMNVVLDEIKEGGQVFFVQFSDTDGLVHKDGVSSETRHRVVKEVDERVRKLKEAMEERFEDPWIIICGDHGMVDCTEYIDIWGMVEEKAKAHKLENGEDYLMFLDSTLARFWFFTDQAKSILSPFLREHLTKGGEWIAESYRKERHISDNPEWYGDMIWKADVCVGIFPDYFHGPDDKYIGMHGYDCSEDTMKGTGIISNEKMQKQILIEEGGLESMCATLCDLNELPTPKTATGPSFIPKHD
jgi:predicted AlkP superfamily pyrophosphatase or phosphodiesterase